VNEKVLKEQVRKLREFLDFEAAKKAREQAKKDNYSYLYGKGSSKPPWESPFNEKEIPWNQSEWVRDWEKENEEVMKRRQQQIQQQMQKLMQENYDTPIMCPMCKNNPGNGKEHCHICVGLGVSPVPASEVKHKVNAYS